MLLLYPDSFILQYFNIICLLTADQRQHPLSCASCCDVWRCHGSSDIAGGKKSI